MEDLINDHIAHQRDGTHKRSKLKLLVPGVGVFFTPLLLEEAFEYQDRQRRISSRRFVPPSFNDIRLILNSAQILSLVRGGPLQLVTFDGDVTLYGMYLRVLFFSLILSPWTINGSRPSFFFRVSISPTRYATSLTIVSSSHTIKVLALYMFIADLLDQMTVNH